MIICDQPEGLELGCAPTVANRSPETRMSAPDARGLITCSVCTYEKPVEPV